MKYFLLKFAISGKDDINQWHTVYNKLRQASEFLAIILIAKFAIVFIRL